MEEQKEDEDANNNSENFASTEKRDVERNKLDVFTNKTVITTRPVEKTPVHPGFGEVGIGPCFQMFSAPPHSAPWSP